jgi:PKD repeat protein
VSTLFSSSQIFAEQTKPFFITTESTKSARINLYCFKSASENIKAKPILLVHGFNSDGSLWLNAKNNYAENLAKNGYDVIIVDMRGNPVDTDGDHLADKAVVGNSWGYGVRDLGDDVGVALKEGMDYLNKNLPGRSYTKADVITHSTGGLAVTAYSRSIGLVPYRNDIDTIIELAPPNNGSTSLIANVKNILAIIPSVFTQAVVVYQYALELSDNKIWIPGSRMESENLRKELSPDSMFLKSIEKLGPDQRIKTFIAIGNEDWVVGDWSPVIEGRDDIGYEYFLGMDHFNFCCSETVLATIIDILEKGNNSSFFKRCKPYRSREMLAFLSGPGIDHPDDTFDVINFAKGIEISPSKLFDLYLRIAARKDKAYLLKYWETLSVFKQAQSEILSANDSQLIIDKLEEDLAEKNRMLKDYFNYASRQLLECPDIAILANGYCNELRKLIIEKVEEPIRLIDHTFEPYILDEQRILVIPSGGLSGLSSSAIFRNKLLRYVENGGILICFTQQYGYDFNALPGGCLKAYGWQEDASCHTKAAYIEDFHQTLSSQQDFLPDIKLDGYFTDYPPDSRILLRRTKNLMPAALIYNFGKGAVIALTLYTDWGCINGQASSSEISLIRDILRWAKTGRDLPGYKPGEVFEKSIETPRDFSKIEMILRSPEGSILEKKISDKAVYKPGFALEKPGIYIVDYILYGADSKIIQPQTEGFYFSFSLPLKGSMDNPDFNFDITSDTENYVSGSEAIFTFHISNNTNKDETIKYKARLQHHNIEFNDTVIIPANTAMSFNKEIIAISTDLLSSCFYSSENNFIGKAERGINVYEPSLETVMSLDKKQYLAGETVSMAAGLKNKKDFALDVLVILDIIGPDNNEIYYDSSETRLSEAGSSKLSRDFKIPLTALKGEYKARCRVFSNSKIIGAKSAYFKVGEEDSTEDLSQKPYIMPGMNMDFIINMEDVYAEGQAVPASVEINNKGDAIPKSFINIRLFPEIETGELCGIIRDDKGAMIEAADVNGVYSNKDGRYKLKNLNKGLCAINVRAEGFDKFYKDIDIFPGNNILDINLTPSGYGNLSGVIENSIGSTLKLEPVNVRGSDASIRFAVTSGDGLFKFGHLAAGNYLLTVSPGGISENIEIVEGENIFNDAVSPAVYEDFQETEPNNDFTGANQLSLNSRLHGRISNAGDEDVFKFNIKEKGVLYIRMYRTPQGLRPSIKIYDAAGKMISMKGGSNGENVILETEFDKPGLYYFLVRDWYGNVSLLDSYSINFNFIKTLDEYEPNDTKEEALLIDFGKSYFATIAVKADSDFYRLSIPDSGKVRIYLKDMPLNIRPYMKLYKDNGQCIDIKGGISGQDVMMEFEVLNPSNYYVQIYDRYNSESSFLRYRLFADYIPLDGYPMSDFAYLEKHEEITDLKGVKTIDFEIPAISEKGKYSVETFLRSLDSEDIARVRKTFYIGEHVIDKAVLKLVYLEDEGLCFNAGDKARFRFKVLNEGGAGGAYDISFKSQDLINDTKFGSLGPGEEREIIFESLLPADMDEGVYEAEYKFQEKTFKVNFRVAGARIEVDAEAVGIFKISVKNKNYTSEASVLSLFAEVRCEGYEKRIDFLLQDEKVLEFNIPELKKKDRVYYGVYFASGKALYLDSLFIKEDQKPVEPSIRVIKAGCDKDIYKDGDDIQVNWKIDSDSAYPVELIADLITPDSDSAQVIYENIALQKGINNIDGLIRVGLKTGGIYRIMYRILHTQIIVANGSLFFDVGEKEMKPNHEPVLLSIGEKEVYAGEDLEFSVEAVDIDNDLLIYSAASLPKGAVFEPITKRFFWRPEEGQIGEYFINFIVSDGKSKASERVKIQVCRPVPVPPGPQALAEPLTGTAPLEVHFSSQAICNSKGIVKYEWDFDGKGVYDFSSYASGETTFIYTGEGDFSAKLRITYRNGVANIYSVPITVKSNPDSPAIYLEALPQKGTAPCRVFFKGDSFCADTIAKYEWDFDGDGVFDASSLESGEVVKTYSVPGTFNAEFRVTSAGGLTSSKIISIEIDDPKTLGVKSLILPDKGSVPLEVRFDTIIEGDRPIQKYQWDFEGDGIFDHISLESGAVKHTYCEPGLYAPIVQVTDAANLSREDKKEINAGVLDVQDIKRARLIANCQKGKAPLTVKFSFDTDAKMADSEYFWDFDGDGACDLVTTVPEAEFAYNDSGSYIAGLKVKIADAIIASSNQIIYVTNGKNNSKEPITQENNIVSHKKSRIELPDKTSLVVPAGLLERDDIAAIRKLESGQIQKEINPGQNIVPAGEYRDYKFENSDRPFNNDLIITIPYADKDNDGIVDDKNIDELTLNAYWYDDKNSEWRIIAGTLIFPKENIVRVSTNHFTLFGLAGSGKKNEGINPAGEGDTEGESSGSSASGVGGGNCFIATAAFGTPLANEVEVLSELRDKVLLKTAFGKKFVKLYYSFGPPIADFIRDKPFLKTAIRFYIKLLVLPIRIMLKYTVS